MVHYILYNYISIQHKKSYFWFFRLDLLDFVLLVDFGRDLEVDLLLFFLFFFFILSLSFSAFRSFPTMAL
jgi:hypothetical protein